MDGFLSYTVLAFILVLIVFLTVSEQSHLVINGHVHGKYILPLTFGVSLIMQYNLVKRDSINKNRPTSSYTTMLYGICHVFVTWGITFLMSFWGIRNIHLLRNIWQLNCVYFNNFGLLLQGFEHLTFHVKFIDWKYMRFHTLKRKDFFYEKTPGWTYCTFL